MKFRFGQKRINRLSSFGTLLPEILHDYKLEKSFTIGGLESQWSNIVGDIISTHSKPEHIKNKVLYIAVDHSVYANEIMTMKDTIVQRINEEFSYSAVLKLKTEVKTIKW